MEPAEPETPAAEQPATERRGLPIGRPRPSAVLVLLPLVGAGAALAVGLQLDRHARSPAPTSAA